MLNLNFFLCLLLLISACVLIYIGNYAWKRDKRYVTLSLVPIIIYSFGYGVEILCTSLEWVMFFVKIEYLGIAFLPAVWLLFVLQFLGYKDRINKYILRLLYVIPIIILIMVYTNDFHHLFYKEVYMNNDGLFPIVELVKGPWYWVNIVYTYMSMSIGLVIFIVTYFKVVSIIRKQILFLILAWIIPWISDIFYLLHLQQFNIDLCPLAFSVSGMISSFAIFKFKLLKLTPIALEKVFYNMSDGVIILDYEDNIINFNNSSKEIILELRDIEPGDKKVYEILMNYREILNVLNNGSSEDCLVRIENDEDLKYYKLNINNIYGNANEIIGRILILNDVTEIELQRKELSDNLDLINKLSKLKETMLNIGYSINETSNINDLLQLILNGVINCIDDKSCGSILLLDENNNLRIAVSKGYNLEEAEGFSVKLEDHFCHFSKGEDIDKTVIINDIHKIEGKEILDTEDGAIIKSAISAPIIIEGELYGFLNIDSTCRNFFKETELELMEYMRAQVSIAIAKHKLYEQTIYLSRYDKLTNVYNRSYFDQLIRNLIENEENKECVLVVFDLNELKFTNDNYGHHVGDELIRTFSRELIKLLGDFDILGRFGGDEFVGVFTNETIQTLTEKLEWLCEEFRNAPIIYEENKIVCSYSYGMVNFPQRGKGFKELLKIADKRMYEYKRTIKSFNHIKLN